MGKGGTVLGIIGLILAAGAIGFTFVVWNGQNNLESDFNSLTRTIVVGIWDELDRNFDYAPHSYSIDWLFEFGGNNLTNTDYISVSHSDTRITLLTPGWYRIHLNVLLDDISPDNPYWIILLEDGDTELYLDRYATIPETPEYSFHYIDSYAFIYSNGTNYIEINGYSYYDDFGITTSQKFNQFTIEYVVI